VDSEVCQQRPNGRSAKVSAEIRTLQDAAWVECGRMASGSGRAFRKPDPFWRAGIHGSAVMAQRLSLCRLMASCPSSLHGAK